MKIDVKRLFSKIGDQETHHYVFFKQGHIAEPLFLFLPSDAKHLYENLKKYFNVIDKNMEGGKRVGAKIKPCARPDISGHLYRLNKKLGTLDIVGRVDTCDWWIWILADHKLGFTPKDYPKHFEKICSCVER